jgi:hypothetical protein
VQDFITDALRARKSKGAKKMADDVYGDNLLKMRAVYDILKLVKAGENTDDKRRFNAKKTTRTDDLVAAVATAIEDDRQDRVQALAKAFDVSAGTIFNIIHDALAWLKRVRDGSPSCCHSIRWKRGWRLQQPLFSWCRKRAGLGTVVYCVQILWREGAATEKIKYLYHCLFKLQFHSCSPCIVNGIKFSQKL